MGLDDGDSRILSDWIAIRQANRWSLRSCLPKSGEKAETDFSVCTVWRTRTRNSPSWGGDAGRMDGKMVPRRSSWNQPNPASCPHLRSHQILFKSVLVCRWLGDWWSNTDNWVILVRICLSRLLDSMNKNAFLRYPTATTSFEVTRTTRRRWRRVVLRHPSSQPSLRVLYDRQYSGEKCLW